MKHDNPLLRRAVLIAAGASTLAASFYAGLAYAADPRLDQANDNLTKAVALLEAAANPDPKREFGGHRKKAIALVNNAKSEIQKAKEFADKPPAEKPKPPSDKAPGPKPPGKGHEHQSPK